MNAVPFVSIIISTKNRRDELIRCITSLKNSTFENFEIIINDNSSTDLSQEEVMRLFPEVRYFFQQIDLGAAAGKNFGASKARGKYFCFVDSDIEFTTHTLHTLVNCFLEGNAAVLGCKIYYKSRPTRVWSQGAFINLYTSKCKHIGSFDDCGQYDHIRSYEHFPTCYILSADTFYEFAGFDERYFIMFEESDLQYRIKSSGGDVMLCPNAHAFHDIVVDTAEDDTLRKIGMFNKMRTYYSSRNRIIYIRKNGSILHFSIFILLFQPIFALYYLFLLLRFAKKEILISYCVGLLDGLKYAFNFKRL